jgi:Rrf2 family protein
LKISTRTRYGLRTMLEIAQSGSLDKGVFQKDISKNQEISNKYLDHIIQALKTSQLITNVRGKKSGYILARQASEITVFDIHRAFEPGICLIECLSGSFKCPMEDGCLTKGFWGQLNNLILNYFKSVTLEDLINKRISIEDAQSVAIFNQ